MRNKNDLSKTSGSSPTSTTETSKPAGGRYLNLDGGKDREDKSMKKDANKQSGKSPTSTTETSKLANNRSPFRAPHWHGEARPHGARRVRLQTRFPSVPYLTYLVRDLGYDGQAAFAALVKAHQPWLRSVDRRRVNPVDADEQAGTVTHEYSPMVSVVHPYVPAVPSRRLKTGGGLTKEQIQVALARKRWDIGMKKAVFEIVYRRRSSLQVSNESGIPVKTLYVYTSRLQQDIQNADSLPGRKAA